MGQKKWLNYYEPGISNQIDYPNLTLSEVLHNSTSRFGNQTSMIYLDHQWTYQELDDLVSRMANLLIDLGIKPGDRVGVQLLNSPQFVFSYFGILRAGAIAVPINPHFIGDDLTYIINNSGMKLIITGVDNIPTLAKTGTKGLKVIVTDIKVAFRENNQYEAPSSVIKLEDVLFKYSNLDPQVKVTPDAIANLQYTGGTTGIYKGAMLTHYNLVVNATQFRYWFKNVYQDGQGKFVCVIPMFHIYAMSTTMNHAILSGSSILILSKFDLTELMRSIDKYKPNLFMGVPAMYGAIAMREGHNYDLSSIEACMCGSAPISVAVHEKFEKITGGKLREGYGLSECAPAVALTPIYGRVKYGSAGVPVPDTDVKIVDPQTGEEITEPNIVGEILVKGPQVMQGYWEQPEETAMVLKDGWLHTGDLGSLDEDGYVFIADRLKDMIIMGGEKIYPREIEDLLYAHPAVKEVAVIGIPHPLLGEVPQAYVVLKQNAAISEKELRKYCAEHLSKFKVPSKIEFIEVLPRNSVGKVLRRLLRETLEQSLV
ncbi:MAG: long-chain fatty acid--CoA ligase [Firmicutes bacterium]|nr:long-chain fatty acid--CoA ligase [Bacillota bacterium]